jgi:hypothetical protein
MYQDIKPYIQNYAPTVKVKIMVQLTVSQSVSQCVSVSSPLWNLWPDIITSCLKVSVLYLWGAPFEVRSAPTGTALEACYEVSVAIEDS